MTNTTPLNEELDKLFEPLIDNPSLTLTSTYWNEAKQELTKLIQTLELKARINELEGIGETDDGAVCFVGDDLDGVTITDRITALNEELDMIDKLIDEHLGMRPNDWPEEFKAFKSQILAEILKVIGEDEKQQWIEDYNMCNTCDFEIMDGSKDCLCFYRNKLKAELRTKFKELFNVKEK